MTLTQRLDVEVMCNHCGDVVRCEGSKLPNGWLSAALAFGRVDVASPGAGIIDASAGRRSSDASSAPQGTLHYCPLSAAQVVQTLGLTVDDVHQDAFDRAELSARGAVE